MDSFLLIYSIRRAVALLCLWMAVCYFSKKRLSRACSSFVFLRCHCASFVSLGVLLTILMLFIILFCRLGLFLFLSLSSFVSSTELPQLLLLFLYVFFGFSLYDFIYFMLTLRLNVQIPTAPGPGSEHPIAILSLTNTGTTVSNCHNVVFTTCTLLDSESPKYFKSLYRFEVVTAGPSGFI